MWHAYRSPNWHSYVTYTKADGTLQSGISMVFRTKQRGKGWIYLGVVEEYHSGVSVSLWDMTNPFREEGVPEHFYQFLSFTDERPAPGFMDELYAKGMLLFYKPRRRQRMEFRRRGSEVSDAIGRYMKSIPPGVLEKFSVYTN